VSWIRIAAELIRGAMSSGDSRQLAPVDTPPPEDLQGVVDLVKRYRAEVDRGFDAVSQLIQEQEQRHQQALRIQRRWNYALLVGILVTMAVVVVFYWRFTS
jgi:hypothetical protein